ncbi:hypothetical protein NQ176_g5442 [Zarea fungicola]|uniref:Uncharacterized protein n=1 Tax=Zarea fungicola TaxID=93591 RepID=A0ACC1N927_9HYPO|nr:hypothetical protein NQ176_g5442 [Lecanicillium fungicola]
MADKIGDDIPPRPRYLLGDKYKVPAEQLTDGVVTLRRWKIENAPDSFDAVEKSMPELEAWMPWAAGGYTIEDAKIFMAKTTADWDAKTGYNYAVIVDGTICGSFGLMNAVIGDTGMGMGYWLGTPWTGHGYATRAASLLTQAAFDCGAELVQIWHNSKNEKSGNVPKRLGYRYVGEYKALQIIETGPFGVWQMDKPE